MTNVSVHWTLSYWGSKAFVLFIKPLQQIVVFQSNCHGEAAIIEINKIKYRIFTPKHLPYIWSTVHSVHHYCSSLDCINLIMWQSYDEILPKYLYMYLCATHLLCKLAYFRRAVNSHSNFWKKCLVTPKVSPFLTYQNKHASNWAS